VPKNGLTAPPEPAPAAGTIPKLIAMAPAAYRNTALTARVVMTLCNLSVRNFRSAKLNIHVVSCTRNLFTLLRPTFFLFKQWRYFCFVAGKGPPRTHWKFHVRASRVWPPTLCSFVRRFFGLVIYCHTGEWFSLL
jgi:hypothetical protein